MRVDASSLIAGALVCGDRGLGVFGSAIPSSGGSGAGYAYNDLTLPADNGKEICGRITSWPVAGTLYAYEDTSFEFSGAPDGSYSFQYQLYVDGGAVGTPVTVSLQVGAISATPAYVPPASGTGTGSGSGGEATTGSGSTPASVPAASGTSTGSGSGGAASGGGTVDAIKIPAYVIKAAPRQYVCRRRQSITPET